MGCQRSEEKKAEKTRGVGGRGTCGLVYLSWAFRRCRAAEWIPARPSRRSARTALSDWRNSTEFVFGSISYMLYQYTVVDNKHMLTRFSLQVHLKQRGEKRAGTKHTRTKHLFRTHFKQQQVNGSGVEMCQLSQFTTNANKHQFKMCKTLLNTAIITSIWLSYFYTLLRYKA